MKRYNMIPNMTPHRATNETIAIQASLLGAKRSLMGELMSEDRDPAVQRIIELALTEVTEHRSQVFDALSGKRDTEMTGMSRIQADLFVNDIKHNLDKMLNKVTFIE